MITYGDAALWELQWYPALQLILFTKFDSSDHLIDTTLLL